MTVLLGARILLGPVDEILPHGVGPLGVDLRGGVDLLVQALETEDVADMALLRADDDFFRQVRGDEDDAGDGAQDHVARQAGRLADAAGDVEARHGDIADAGGVDAAVVDVDALDLDDLLQVADAAPDDGAAALGAGLDGGGQVAADVGALEDLVEHVDDDDVVLDQGVDDPLVEVALAALFLMAVLEQVVVQVRAHGDHDAGHRAADKGRAGVGRAELALELILIALVPQGAPGLLQGDLAQTAQHVRRNLGTAVFHALALPKGRNLDDVFFTVELHVDSLPSPFLSLRALRPPAQ